MNSYHAVTGVEVEELGTQFLLLFDLPALHLRTFSQGVAIDNDSENVCVVGAITLSSVVVCWEGKDFQ